MARESLSARVRRLYARVATLEPELNAKDTDLKLALMEVRQLESHCVTYRERQGALIAERDQALLALRAAQQTIEQQRAQFIRLQTVVSDLTTLWIEGMRKP